jgi:hypothetical protein
MPLSADVLTVLEGLELGVAARSLFTNALPDEPDVCGAVYDTAGPAPIAGFGQEGIVADRPNGQIKFRGAPGDLEGPRVQAMAAYRGVSKIGTTINGTFYRKLWPMQAPFRLDVDVKGRSVWAFNVSSEMEIA